MTEGGLTAGARNAPPAATFKQLIDLEPHPPARARPRASLAHRIPSFGSAPPFRPPFPPTARSTGARSQPPRDSASKVPRACRAICGCLASSAASRSPAPLLPARPPGLLQAALSVPPVPASVLHAHAHAHLCASNTRNKVQQRCSIIATKVLRYIAVLQQPC